MNQPKEVERAASADPARSAPSELRSVCITGAAGYLGSLLCRQLSGDPGSIETILALDIRVPKEADQLDAVTYEQADITKPERLRELMQTHKVDTVIHLATVVNTNGMSRELQRAIDVEGTRNVIEAALACGAAQIVVTSSGAAYGYHADNPAWLTEDMPLRGNEAFPYSQHKREQEEVLASYRVSHPQLKQLVFRPGTILGASTKNQITAMFDRRVVMGLSGHSTPFVLIWDEDVVLAGDGVLTLRDIARMTGKRFVALPTRLVKGALSVLKKLKLTGLGPEQTLFLEHRPVLWNQKLKEEFGFTPRKSTREVFEHYWSHKS
ncbi:MAG: NAD-dependent epimerase/dehydratase family protein [Planctomycetota bacterium]|jgi:UDP-glucose 4-epimerase